MAIPPAPAPTRQDWAALTDAEWDDLVLELVELVLFYARQNAGGLRAMVRSRILSGEKFGPLDLAGMDFPLMFGEEIADAVAYLAGERLHERTKAR